MSREQVGAADVVTLGETMVLMRSSRPGPLATSATMDLGIGGAESNVAIGLSRLGTDVAWIGRVGADSMGEKVLRELRAEGIRVHGIRDAAAPTGLMIKERRTPDTAKVWYYRSGSAGSRLAPADVPKDAVAAAKLLHVTGITPALSESAAAAVAYAVDCARDGGTLVSLDLNYRSALWDIDTAGPVLRKLISGADIVFAGDDEAGIALGATGTPSVLAAGLAGLGPSQVIIKLGAAGCLALIDGRESVQGAVPVRVVDTVGAGDAFVAGYLAELLQGKGPRVRLETAVRAGAFSCLSDGDWEGLPTRNDLSRLEDADPVQR